MAAPDTHGTQSTAGSLYKWKDEDGVVYGPRVRSWGGWPDDIRDEVRRWNSARGLSFVYLHQRVFECDDCHRYIDHDGSTVCSLKGVLLCDDCLAARARAHLSTRAVSA